MLAEVPLATSIGCYARNGHHCLRCGCSHVCDLRPIFLVLQKVLIKLCLEVELILDQLLLVMKHLLLLLHV